MSRLEAKKLIHDLFEEEALVVGGLVAVHDVEDDFVWRLMQSLDSIRSRALQRIETPGTESIGSDSLGNTRLRSHPAVEEFLITLRRRS